MLALLLAAALARADDSTAVLVASFQPSAPEAGGVASLLENLVAETLDDAVAVRVIRIEETRPFADYGARIYMEGCPPDRGSAAARWWGSGAARPMRSPAR